MSWKPYGGRLTPGLGALPRGATVRVGGAFFHRRVDGALLRYGFGAAADEPPPDCGPNAQAVVDENGDWTCVATPGTRGGSASGDNRGGQTSGTKEAPPPSGPPSPAPPPSLPPGPTPASTSTTNWTPWLIGGAAVLGVGLIGWALFSKPKSKELRHAAKRSGEEASRYRARARRLRHAAKRRAAEERMLGA